MAAYVMLTKLSPEALARPNSVEKLERQVEDRIEKECPEVKWLANYAVLGPFDYLDVFEAPDTDTATKVSLIVRSFGHATAETWLAEPWKKFLEVASEIRAR
ncbi:MAG: GYD domain-containing protein [Chloroflexi bacterium]|nr:GYD domain-containing protein [Chloroflexota bacterium]